MPSADVPSQPGPKTARYFTPAEIELHNKPDSCWLSWLGKVYDVTPLIKQHSGDQLLRPILENAGKDISHWFDPVTRNVKTHVDPQTGVVAPFTPQGRFLHVPPSMPRTDWRNDIKTPWWQDETYCIGTLTKKTRKIKIINTLTRDEHILEVCSEEPISHIQDRYLQQFNAHAKGYIWKRVGNTLELSRTLDENGIPDESPEFEKLGIDMEEWLPVIHLYFSDDLTVA